MKNFIRTFCLTCCIVPLASWATTPVTTAFLRVIDGGSQTNDFTETIATDPSGNMYFAAESPIIGFNLWTFYKYSPYGAKIWSQTIPVPLASKVHEIAADASGNLYVAGMILNTNQNLFALKFTSSGHLIWMRELNLYSALIQKPIALSYNPAGGMRIALEVTKSNDEGLGLLTVDAQGVATNIDFDHNLRSVSGEFNSDGFFLGAGYDSSQNARWAFYDAAHFLIKSETSTNNATFQYDYQVHQDKTGTLFVATNANLNGTRACNMRAFDMTGSVLWTVSPLEGRIDNFAASDPQNVYPVFSLNGDFQLGRIDSTKLVWTVPTPAGSAIPDGTGVILQEGGAQQVMSMVLDRYLPSGALDWTVNAPVATGTTWMFMQPVSIQNGTCYAVGEGPTPSNGWDTFIYKICPGLSVKSISTATPHLTGGLNLTGSVNLNAKAPVTTLVGFASSNPALVSVPASITVPKALTAAGFIGYTAVVDVPTYVTLTAKEGGVARTLTVQLLPNLMTALSLTPSTVKAGVASSAKVLLAGPCGIAGRTITLTSSDPTIAKVPASVKILSGGSTINATVTTFAGKTGPVTITATSGGVTISKTLQVTP